MGIQEFNQVYKLDEFLKLEEKSDVPLEFINGYIYAKSFTSINHNRIVNRINARIDDYLGEKPCMVLSEQIEVVLGEDRVKPDVFVVCKNHEGKYERIGQSFITIPTLIFEVVSHSNARLDTVTKMDLYAKSGIEEYNLVYQEGEIHQYKLNEYGVYYLNKSYKKNDVYKGIALEGLDIDINSIFKGLEV
ncbi:MAG: Uma2 family endonuclease [Clostridium sp.]